MLKALGSKYDILKDEETKEFYNIIKDLIDDDYVIQMQNFAHHYSTTCYQHCLNVSYYNYLLCRKLGLDKRAGARGGMLHDLFLYNWRNTKRQKGEFYHAFSHGRIALLNAKSRFELNKYEENMIVSHMFPLSYDLPRYRESFVLTIVDKYCAVLEVLVYIYQKISNEIIKLSNMLKNNNNSKQKLI